MCMPWGDRGLNIRSIRALKIAHVDAILMVSISVADHAAILNH